MPTEDGLPDLADLRSSLDTSLAAIDSPTIEKLLVSGSRVVNYQPTLQIFLETLPCELQEAVVNAFLVQACEELKRRQGN